MYDNALFTVSRWLLPVIGFYIIAGCAVSLFRGNTKTGTLGYLVNTITGDRLALKGYETAIGRSYACDITLAYDTVSRFHAVLTKRGDRWLLFDTQSKNGTFVGDERVDSEDLIPLEVLSGDILSFGNASFYFFDIEDLAAEEEDDEDYDEYEEEYEEEEYSEDDYDEDYYDEDYYDNGYIGDEDEDV